MTASTLPRVAALVWDSGPYYAARSIVHGPDESNVVWVPSPALPDATFRWAEDAEVRSEHVTLDVRVLSELLFASGADPAALDNDEAMAAVDGVLRRVHCDMTRCSAEVCAAMAERWECAGAWFDGCVIRAARMLEVTV